MGEWIYRVPEHHKHDVPNTVSWYYANKTMVGDRWKCNCGEVFEVTNVKLQYDQRDGDFAYVSWAKYSMDEMGEK